jgi:hypothetical protein
VAGALAAGVLAAGALVAWTGELNPLAQATAQAATIKEILRAAIRMRSVTSSPWSAPLSFSWTARHRPGCASPGPTGW